MHNHPPPSASSYARPARALGLLLCAAAAALALLCAGPARAAVDRGKQETLQEYEQQLASHQITSATINRRLHRVHVVLKNGTPVYAVFVMHGEGPIESGLHSAHVSYTVMTPAEAEQEANESPHTKKFARRYIAAIVIGVLVIAGIVFFFVRRRRNAMLE